MIGAESYRPGTFFNLADLRRDASRKLRKVKNVS